MNELICEIIQDIVISLKNEFGEIPTFGQLQSIKFQHSLARNDQWAHMKTTREPMSGSATTLAMAAHLFPTRYADSEKITVQHGPVFRWVVDLADTAHIRFVTSGGNGGRVDSQFVTDHFPRWARGQYFDLSFERTELNIVKREEF